MTRTRTHLAAAAAIGTCVVLASAGVASAATTKPAKKPPATLTAVYPASGSSYIANPKSTVAIGPTTLTTKLNLTKETFTGALPVPPATATFDILGFLPVSATVSLIPAGPLHGKLVDDSPGATLTSTSTYTIQLSNVTVAGIPAGVGTTCETTAPVAIHAGAPHFDVLLGGTLTGTYTIGDFSNCGLTTPLINVLVPGAGNTLTLTLGKPTIS